MRGARHEELVHLLLMRRLRSESEIERDRQELHSYKRLLDEYHDSLVEAERSARKARLFGIMAQVCWLVAILLELLALVCKGVW